MRGPGHAPLTVPGAVWKRDDMRAACRSRDFGRLFGIVARCTGASNMQLATATGMTPSRVSLIRNGRAQVEELEVYEKIADGLGMPDGCRMMLGLAPRHTPEVSASERTTGRPSADSGVSLQALLDGIQAGRETSVATVGQTGEEGDDAVKRRGFLAVASGSALAAVFDAEPEFPADDGLPAALLRHRMAPTPHQEGTPPDLALLTDQVAALKRDYQGSRYARVSEALPSLLRSLDVAPGIFAEDHVATIHSLSAEVHHVAASVLLKRADPGLAMVAASRSIDEAHASDDPVMVASSTRILTHALMSDGHNAEAKDTAMAAAAQLDSAFRRPSPDALSVYGALLLRGAIAAARDQDRASAVQMLDEAAAAARRLGGDYNLRWTAFGPTNVLLHRVNVSVALGDAGAAVDLARQVELSRVELNERKACLFIDTARAFVQWGRWPQAYGALSIAEQIAPEEITTRPSVRALVGEVMTQAPRSIRTDARDLACRTGADW